MADYTVAMFQQDQTEIIPILQMLKDIKIPESEWPKTEINGQTFTINPNSGILDSVDFFINKYGKERGLDYVQRFINIVWFFQRHREELAKRKLIVEAGAGNTGIPERLLNVMLESIASPQPPANLPTSPLADQFMTFDLDKVVNAVKAKK